MVKKVISLDQLCAEHLRRYWSIYAVDGQGAREVKVWDGNKLLPFMARAEEPELAIRELHILTGDFDDLHLAPLVQRIAALDPYGSQRIIGGYRRLTEA
jgi:hypothetical protein